MEVKIGVQHAQRELVVETATSAEDVEKQVADAVSPTASWRSPTPRAAGRRARRQDRLRRDRHRRRPAPSASAARPASRSTAMVGTILWALIGGRRSSASWASPSPPATATSRCGPPSCAASAASSSATGSTSTSSASGRVTARPRTGGATSGRSRWPRSWSSPRPPSRPAPAQPPDVPALAHVARREAELGHPLRRAAR